MAQKELIPFWEQKKLIGFWSSSDIEIELGASNEANLNLMLYDKSANGYWRVEEDILRIKYEFRGIKQLAKEFKFNGAKYSQELTLKIISFDDHHLKLIDMTNNQIIELKKDSIKTASIYIKEEKKEDLIQAYVIVLMISALAGPVIRWLINPDIPSWLIIATIFIISLFLIRRNKY